MTTTPKQYEIHPLAEIFPSIEGPAFDALVKDIEARDQQEHAWIYESKILDGKNRYEACKKLGRELKVHFYTGDDPVGFVLSANLHRRQLDTSQRAMVAAGLANLKVGTNRFTKKVGPSIEVAAQLLNVGRASVERAKIVLGSGDPDLIKAVQTGEMAVSEAAAQAQQQQDQQPEQQPNPVDSDSDKSKKTKKKKKKDLKPEKEKIEYVKATDPISASKVYRMFEQHLVEALEDFSQHVTFDHVTQYVEDTVDALRRKLNQIDPDQKDDDEETTEELVAAE